MECHDSENMACDALHHPAEQPCEHAAAPDQHGRVILHVAGQRVDLPQGLWLALAGPGILVVTWVVHVPEVFKGDIVQKVP